MNFKSNSLKLTTEVVALMMARHTLMIGLRQRTKSACYCVQCFF